MNSVKSWKTILAACVAMTAASAYGAARAGPRWVDRLWRRSRQHALQPAETGQHRQRAESQGRVGLATRLPRSAGVDPDPGRRHALRDDVFRAALRVAVNAKDGAIRWKYAPEIPGDIQATTCCGLDNRGAAYADGKVFVARLDGYLVALDAKTGKELWKTQVVDYKRAPRLRRRRRSSRIWSSPVLPEANMVSVALSAHSTRVPESWYGEPIRFRAKASPVAKPGKGIPGSTAAEPLGMSALLIRN